MESLIDAILCDAHLLDAFLRSLISSLLLRPPKRSDGNDGCSSDDFYAAGRRFEDEALFSKDGEHSGDLFKHLQAICESVVVIDGGLCKRYTLPESLLDDSSLSLYDNIVSAVDKILANVISPAQTDIDSGDAYCKFLQDNTSLFNKLSTLYDVCRSYLAVDRKRLLLSCTDATGAETGSSSSSKGPVRDNSLASPFRPLLTRKVFSIKEEKFELKLQQKKQLSAPVVEARRRGGTDFQEPETFYPHPYRRELRSLIHPAWQLEDAAESDLDLINAKVGEASSKIGSCSELSDTAPQVEVVSTKKDFDKLMDTIEDLLSTEALREVGVAVATHDYRSFQGTACWLALSLRGDINKQWLMHDYVIDAAALKSDLHRLDLVMANPLILKVLHGARHTLAAMQRDMGLYIVNCFDICEGAKGLHLPRSNSLHQIVMYYDLPRVDSGYLRDWRSASTEASNCASQLQLRVRCLLPLFHRMRRDLLRMAGGREGVEMAFNASRKLCLERYEKAGLWKQGYRKLYISASPEDDTQEAALAKLWEWRDTTARKVDESPLYVMSSSEMLRIALSVPISADDLEACKPLSRYTRAGARELLDLMCSLPPRMTTHGAATATATSPVGREAQTPIRDLLADGSSSPSFGEGYCCSTLSVQIRFPNRQPSPLPHGHRGASPVMPADEIFKLAGWNSPIGGRDLSPLFFSATAGGTVSIDGTGSNRASVSSSSVGNSIEVVSLTAMRSSMDTIGAGSIDDCDASSSSSALLAAVGSHELADSCSIPTSFEEIYEISNRNRRRGREKSRGEGDDDVDEPANPNPSPNPSPNPNPGSSARKPAHCYPPLPVDYSAGDFDEQVYFANGGSGAVEGAASVDATLDFAEDIGWLTSKELRMRVMGDWIADQSVSEMMADK